MAEPERRQCSPTGRIGSSVGADGMARAAARRFRAGGQRGLHPVAALSARAGQPGRRRDAALAAAGQRSGRSARRGDRAGASAAGPRRGRRVRPHGADAPARRHRPALGCAGAVRDLPAAAGRKAGRAPLHRVLRSVRPHPRAGGAFPGPDSAVIAPSIGRDLEQTLQRSVAGDTAALRTPGRPAGIAAAKPGFPPRIDCTRDTRPTRADLVTTDRCAACGRPGLDRS